MCPVCQSILHQPVLFPCGNHSACRSCLLTYLASEIVVDEALDTGEARCPSKMPPVPRLRTICIPRQGHLQPHASIPVRAALPKSARGAARGGGSGGY